MQWHEFCINEQVEEKVVPFVEIGLTFLLASATRSLTKYSLIRDVTCLFGSHLNMHQRKGQMKRKGEKKGKNFFVTVPLQKGRLMFIFRLGQEGLPTHEG